MEISETNLDNSNLNNDSNIKDNVCKDDSDDILSSISSEDMYCSADEELKEESYVYSSEEESLK